MKRLKKIIFSVTVLITNLSFARYEVHEWGTFTSVVGSNGITQNGMYHEDEALPSFVHPFGEVQSIFNIPTDENQCPIFSKSCFSFETLQKNVVTQKMETPVLYFYSDLKRHISVDVQFPEGIITETFPAPTKSAPKNIEGVEFKNGAATFEIDILTDQDVKIPDVEEDNIYGHARATSSNFVRSGFDYEKFIFYRGLGRFYPRIHVVSKEQYLSISARTANLPKYAYLVNVSKGGNLSALQIIGGELDLVKQGGFDFKTVSISPQYIEMLKSETHSSQMMNETQVEKSLVESLVLSGLYKDEAIAMVNTWKNGYFNVPGLRLLYILPKIEVDNILPLKITPSPESFERVFVGRLELMLEADEKLLVAQIIKEELNFDLNRLGRFAESQLRRAKEVYIERRHFQAPEIDDSVNIEYVFDTLILRSMLDAIQSPTRD